MNPEKSEKIFDHLEWLDNLAPSFDVDGGNVDILNEPMEFYNEIINLVGQSKRRIVLASLYLGTGAMETRLIESLQAALNNCNSRDGGSRIYVRFLLDYSRGTRGEKNSCTMIQPLKQQFGDRVDVVLFHTPLLRGLWKCVLPGRWNEVLGVQHMKLYIFDDTLMISGANLSNDYFTNRQDRYLVIRNCPEIAEFYSTIVEAVSTCSFNLKENGKLAVNAQCEHHPFTGDQQRFSDMMKQRINAVIEKWRIRYRAPAATNDLAPRDTRVYTLLQMGPIGIDDEDTAIRRILTQPSVYATPNDTDQRIDLASGYFNLTAQYEHLILRKSFLKYRILMASPKANGFFNGSGLSGYIPSVYVYVARLFYDAMNELKHNRRIQLFEYVKQGWTFHAKGMWLTMLKDDLPSVTLIGSTNYGYRSLHRDLETGLVIVTDNARLRQQLRMERERLFNHTFPIDASTFRRGDHYVPIWVRWVAKMWRNFF